MASFIESVMLSAYMWTSPDTFRAARPIVWMSERVERRKISDVTDMLAREQVDTQTLLEGGYRKEKSKRERSDATGGGRAVTSGQRAEAELAELIEELSAQMMTAAQHLQFEVAARLRDEIEDLKKELRAMKRAH